MISTTVRSNALEFLPAGSIWPQVSVHPHATQMKITLVRSWQRESESSPMTSKANHVCRNRSPSPSSEYCLRDDVGRVRSGVGLEGDLPSYSLGQPQMGVKWG